MLRAPRFKLSELHHNRVNELAALRMAGHSVAVFRVFLYRIELRYRDPEARSACPLDYHILYTQRDRWRPRFALRGFEVVFRRQDRLVLELVGLRSSTRPE